MIALLSNRSWMRIIVSLVLFSFPLEGKDPEAGTKISIVADRTDATYAIGELVTFVVTVSQDGIPVKEGSIKWSLTKDGVDPVTQGAASLETGNASVSGRLSEPGFLQCKVGFQTATELVRGIGAAAIDPMAIQASRPAPEDFDAFWTSKKAALDHVPLNAKLTPVKTKHAGIEVFDVQAEAIGDRPMRGYLARPTGAAPKSLPAIVTFEGAGVYPTRMEPWLTGWAKDGFLSLELNAHGIPNSEPVEYYLDLEKGELKDYQFAGRNSRETFYFLNMYLRALQGVNFLTSQPEWNGRVLISSGASQGAAQAIFIAAMDPRVTFLMAAVPGMCDHSGMLARRVSGWPRLVPNGVDGQPDPAVLETSRYFDSVNFATRIRVPTLFVSAFVDQVAPPTSVYAAYNCIKSEKEIYPGVFSPHKLEPEIWQEVRRRVLLRKNR